MREQFQGYYRPTKEEFTDLWADADIAIDANALLNLYRYSIETRKSLLNVLGGLKPQLWLPHQSAFEYHQNRIRTMTVEKGAYEHILKSVDDSERSINAVVLQHRRHLILQPDEIAHQVENAFETIREYIRTKQALHPDLPEDGAPGDVDPIRDQLTELFEGRVGQGYSAERLEALYREGSDRFERKIPPGYADSGKDGVRKYGDFIIWMQLIDRARETKKPIIFVTDDEKEDWWFITSGKTILPRPELVEEMWQKAGVRFYMYGSERFVEQASSRYGRKLPDEAAEEMTAVARQLQDSRQLHDEIQNARRRELLLRASYQALGQPDPQSDEMLEYLQRLAPMDKRRQLDDTIRSLKSELHYLTMRLDEELSRMDNARSTTEIDEAEVRIRSLQDRVAKVRFELESYVQERAQLDLEAHGIGIFDRGSPAGRLEYLRLLEEEQGHHRAMDPRSDE